MTATLDPADSGGWLNWITNYDQTAQSFTDNYNALVALRPWVVANAPQELPNVDQLLTDGQTHAATLQKLKETRDYVASWLNWLANGYNAGVDFLQTNAAAAYNAILSFVGLNGMGSLGIAPIVVAVGLAAAAAALVVIGYWIQKAYATAQRLNALQALTAQGLSPDAAAAAVNNTMGPPGGTDGDNLLGIPWTWLITGAVLIVVGPKVIELFDKRGRLNAA
jgi:hypothetical protein